MKNKGLHVVLRVADATECINYLQLKLKTDFQRLLTSSCLNLYNLNLSKIMDNYLSSIIEKLRAGINVEGTNVDIKQQWWDLRLDLDEFLKDICAMGNSHGGDSYILVGFNKAGSTFNAPLPLDEADIQAKHKDKIEPKLRIEISEHKIEDKIISIIKIPRSLNRPHIIKKYKQQANWIPIRFGSSTLAASRSDIEAMYAERAKASQPRLKVSFHEEALSWANFAGYMGASFAVRLNFDNYDGETPEIITKIYLLEKSGERWTTTHFKFERDNIKIDEPFFIPERKILTNILLYLSDRLPDGLDKKPMPDFDRDTLHLLIECRSGNKISLPIKPGWIRA